MRTPDRIRHPLLWVPTGYFTMAMGYIMLTSVTAIMFKNIGMDNGRAAAYSSSLIFAYTAKPLFAPFVEMYRTKKFFVLLMQVLIALGFAGAGLAMGMPDFMVVPRGRRVRMRKHLSFPWRQARETAFEIGFADRVRFSGALLLHAVLERGE